MSQRIAFTVKGKVQGVNFRYYTAREANKIGVTGWVQNDDAGSVSGEAQGAETKLQDFLKIVKEGPPLARVSDLEHSKIEVKQNESKFVQYR